MYRLTHWLKFLIDTIKGVAEIVADSKLGLISAGVAFFSMLAVFPAVAAIISLFGYFADPRLILGQVQLLADFIPADAFEILNAQVRALVAANVSTLGWTSVISTGAALWSARAGIAALMEGLNATHRADNRSGVWHYAASALLTLVLVGVALVALSAAIFMPILLAIIPLGPFYALALGTAKWGISVAVVLFGVGLAYRYGPNRSHVRSAWFSPGLLLAVTLWAAASIGFSYYIANFSSYNRVYGSIGAVIALLMWFYISAYVILLGGALNAELERHHKVQ